MICAAEKCISGNLISEKDTVVLCFNCMSAAIHMKCFGGDDPELNEIALKFGVKFQCGFCQKVRKFVRELLNDEEKININGKKQNEIITRAAVMLKSLINENDVPKNEESQVETVNRSIDGEIERSDGINELIAGKSVEFGNQNKAHESKKPAEDMNSNWNEVMSDEKNNRSIKPIRKKKRKKKSAINDLDRENSNADMSSDQDYNGVTSSNNVESCGDGDLVKCKMKMDSQKSVTKIDQSKVNEKSNDVKKISTRVIKNGELTNNEEFANEEKCIVIENDGSASDSVYSSNDSNVISTYEDQPYCRCVKAAKIMIKVNNVENLENMLKSILKVHRGDIILY
jgi:hypothetical protein